MREQNMLRRFVKNRLTERMQNDDPCRIDPTDDEWEELEDDWKDDPDEDWDEWEELEDDWE